MKRFISQDSIEFQISRMRGSTGNWHNFKFQALTYIFRTKLNLSLNDECARAKRLLDEKYFEAGRLREDAVSKGDQCADQRADKADLDREIEAIKIQRAEMYREISHLKDHNEQKALEAGN